MGRAHKPSRRQRRNHRKEWVGGRVSPPVYITSGEPQRAEMFMWLEIPPGIVVSVDVIDPAEPISFGESLRSALESPVTPEAHTPARIRVATPELAAEARAAAPELEVVVAPTPELAMVMNAMAESLSGGEEFSVSYLEGGRVSEDAVERLFVAAKALYHVAPWEHVLDSQVLRLDVPHLGVEGACVSIIGQLGESLGFIIFPSKAAYESFLETVDAGFELEDGVVDFGTSSLALNYEAATDLPPPMRREAASHGWPVAAPQAYPVVQHREQDCTLRPLSERDVQLVTMCATSLVSFFVRNKTLFDRGAAFRPVSESYTDNEDRELRFTIPYEAGAHFGLRDGAAPSGARRPATTGSRKREKVGRNQPCPCGSGKKYKRCCLLSEKDAASRTGLLADRYRRDDLLVDDMVRFAETQYREVIRVAARDFQSPEDALSLLPHWIAFHVELDGVTVVERFVGARRRLAADDRSWLKAQRAAWLSMWEVVARTPAGDLELRDILTHETRTINAFAYLSMIETGQTVLGRVVDHGGSSYLCGVYPRTLGPSAAAEVEERARKRLRRKTAVPVERLRPYKFGRFLIARWEEKLDELMSAEALTLHNTDGDELIITADHFSFANRDRARVEQMIAGLRGVDPPGPSDAEPVYTFLREGNDLHDWEHTVIGRASFSRGKLRVDSNSIERADELRARVEAACRGLLKHRGREHADPDAMLDDLARSEPESDAPVVASPEADALVREYKSRHYKTWPDHQLPALGGNTPREAARTKQGRRKIEVMLKEFEISEARMPEAQRFDFTALRRELGVEEAR